MFDLSRQIWTLWQLMCQLLILKKTSKVCKAHKQLRATLNIQCWLQAAEQNKSQRLAKSLNDKGVEAQRLR